MLQLAWAFNWHLLADDGRPEVTFAGPIPSHWYNTDQTVGILVLDTGGGRPASGVAGFSDAWNADPGDPTTEATPGAGNSFYGGPEFVKTTSSTLDLAAEGQGCHTVNVEAWDNMGLQSGDVLDGPLCFDSVAPSITIKPTIRLLDHVRMAGPMVPVTIQWKGTDATSGINHYTLYRSKDGAPFVHIDNTTATHLNVDLTPGHKFRYEVTATDNAGNTSAAGAGSTYTLSAFQENSKAIKYSTGWKRQKLTGAYGGLVDSATAAGKTATLTFSGFQVAWVSTLGSTRGSARVSLNGGASTTISTHASSTKTAEIVDTVLVPTGKGKKKLVVKVLGTAKHPRVDIDAFIVLAG
jgi:hypothetical protein